MIIVQSIGYLPYSDRPSPGWYKEELSISWNEITYIWNFILFLGIYVFAVLILVFGLFHAFRLIGYNRIIYSILGGLIIGFLTLYITTGIGWYIAIDLSTTIVGGVLGILYGATLFPNYLKPNNEELRKHEAQQ